MSTQAGAIYVKVELDESNFDKGLASLNAKTEKSGGFLSNALSFATGGAILGGLSAIKDGIGSIASKMIDGNAQFETYQTQFGVLLGSADAAKERLAELAKFGASTPFELPELVQADKVLTSFGIHSQDMLTIVGDVAAGTGASFQDMALLMGEFSAGATGEVLSQFQKMGVATKTELANMGIEFDKAGSMTTPVAEAMPILEQIMKDKFGGMMDAQSKTFDGMMSNLQDWVGGTLRTLGQPIFEVVKDKLGVLITFLSSPEVQATLSSLAESLATGIGSAIDFLANDAIPALIEAWNTLQPAVQFVLDLFTQAGDGAGVLGGYIKMLGDAWQGLSDIIDALMPPIQSIVLSVFGVIQEFLHQHGDDIKAFLGTAWAQISEIIKVAVQLINATIVPIFQEIAKFIAAHKETIVAVLTAAWTIIKNVIDAALTLIMGILRVFLDIATGQWSKAWEDLKAMSARFVKDIWEVLKAGFDLIVNVVKLAIDGVIAIFTNLYETLVGHSIIPDLVNSVLRFFTQMKDDAITLIQGFVTGALDVFNGLVSEMENIGGNIVQGIQDGFSSAWGRFTSWVQGKIDEIPQVVRDVLGIHSPSTVMAYEVGRPIVEGIMKGMQEELPKLLNYASDMADDLVKTISDATKQISSLIAGAFDAEANLDRQQIQNLKDISEMPIGLRDAMNRTLGKALEEAQQIADPAQQAKYFQMRSRQIFEAEKLRQEYMDAYNAGNMDQADLLMEQMRLLEDAQKAEQAAFKERMEQQKSANEDMALKMADALAKAFDPVMAELLRKFLELVGLAGTVLLPAPPMGTESSMSSGASLQNGRSGGNTYVLQIQSNNPAPLMQEFSMLEALAGGNY